MASSHHHHHPVLASASAVAVGNLFALKYYTMLNSSPQTLFHFYKERSVLTHGYEEDSQTLEETVVGQESINKKLHSLHFQDCKVALSAVDCQESQDGGVLILVVGSLSNKGGPPRKFVQTFYLAVQTEPAGYYVLNDVFRYLKDPSFDSIAPPSPASNGHTESYGASVTAVNPLPAVSPKPPTIEKIDTPLPVVPATIPNSNHVHQEKQPELAKSTATSSAVASASPVATTHKEVPSQTQETKKEAAQPTVSGSTIGDKIVAPVPTKATKQPQTVPPKVDRSSWASLVSNPLENEGKFQQVKSIAVPTADTSNKPVSATKVASNLSPTITAPPQVSEKTVDDQKLPRQKFSAAKPVLKEGCSVYVSNIPFSVEEEQIRATFKNLSPIKSIVMRAPKGYCFIEYATSEIVQQVVQACKTSPVVMEGRTLSVEERKLKTEIKTEREKKDRKVYFGTQKKYPNSGTPVDDTNGGTKDDGEKWQKFQKKNFKNQQ